MAASSRLAVLLGAQGSLSPADVAVAAAGEIDLVFVADRAESGELVELAAQLFPTIRADFSDAGACAEAVRAARVVAVTTFVDRLCPLLFAVRRELAGAAPDAAGTPGAAVAAWSDKDAQRRHLVAAGASSVRSVLLDSPGHLPAALRSLRLPVVVKPVDGVSSRDVWLIGDEAAAATFADPGRGARDGRYCAEEYIVGSPRIEPYLADYVSAEVFRPPAPQPAVVPTVITDRLVPAPPLRETGLVLPSTLGRPASVIAAASAERALDALDASGGAFHVELKPGEQAAEIVEVNGRLGGYVNRLARYTAGADFGRCALAAAIGGPAEWLPAEIRWRRCALVLLYPPPADAVTVAGAPTRAELMRLPGALGVEGIARPGTAVSWRDGSGAAVATVWLGGDDHDELRRRLAATARLMADRFAFVGRHGEPVRDDAWLGEITSGK
jgi:biotin carboxylase